MVWYAHLFNVSRGENAREVLKNGTISCGLEEYKWDFNNDIILMYDINLNDEVKTKVWQCSDKYDLYICPLFRRGIYGKFYEENTIPTVILVNKKTNEITKFFNYPKKMKSVELSAYTNELNYTLCERCEFDTINGFNFPYRNGYNNSSGTTDKTNTRTSGIGESYNSRGIVGDEDRYVVYNIKRGTIEIKEQEIDMDRISDDAPTPIMDSMMCLKDNISIILKNEDKNFKGVDKYENGKDINPVNKLNDTEKDLCNNSAEFIRYCMNQIERNKSENFRRQYLLKIYEHLLYNPILLIVRPSFRTIILKNLENNERMIKSQNCEYDNDTILYCIRELKNKLDNLKIHRNYIK